MLQMEGPPVGLEQRERERQPFGPRSTCWQGKVRRELHPHTPQRAAELTNHKGSVLQTDPLASLWL